MRSGFISRRGWIDTNYHHQVTPNSRLPHAGLGKGGVEAAREFTMPLYASGLDYLASNEGDGSSNLSRGAKLYAIVAQLAEQVFRKHQVGGSKPLNGSKQFIL